jgi:hypothetical protein
VYLRNTAAAAVLQISARDQNSKWLTALTLLDDDTFIAADNGHNLVSLPAAPDDSQSPTRCCWFVMSGLGMLCALWNRWPCLCQTQFTC